MAYTIDQFMWGYQSHFASSLKHFTERILNEIDVKFKPNVFLIGVLVEEKPESHTICLEPEDCGYSQNSFKEVKKLAEELLKADSETLIHHSHPVAQKNHDKRLYNNSMREAVEKIINRDSSYDGLMTFVSYPNMKDGYLVFCVIQIKKSAFDKHYRLFQNKWEERYNLSTSLIISVINEILELAANELFVPDAGAYTSFTKYNSDEIMRRAGENFSYTVSSKGGNFDGLHGLFNACNIISSLMYENQEVNGTLIIAPQKHENIKLNIKLDEPFSITEYRKVRKFLELTSEKNHLISDSAFIYGLGEIIGNYNPISENLFLINFTKHYHWELYHSNNSLMKVSYNIPSVPRYKINKEKYFTDFRRIFPKSTDKDAENIWSIIEEAINQKHGTMLVISDGAEKESVRLRGQSFKINKTFVDSSFIKKITNIDGALLLDYTAQCYSIGVILDGLASDKGNSARGARYNSAVKYYESFRKEHNTLILIVSEDGMIDFIPNLIPQVAKSSILKMKEALQNMRELDNISVKQFNQLMGIIYSCKFYFTKEDCDEINKNRKDIENKLRKNEVGFIQIVRNDLEPNKEMNDSYFLTEEPI